MLAVIAFIVPVDACTECIFFLLLLPSPCRSFLLTMCKRSILLVSFLSLHFGGRVPGIQLAGKLECLDLFHLKLWCQGGSISLQMTQVLSLFVLRQDIPMLFRLAGTHYVAQVGLEFMIILLPQPPECRDYRHVPP